MSMTLGFAWLRLATTDALGDNATQTFPLLAITTQPSVALNVSPTLADSGERVALVGVVSGGTPPVNWSIITSASIQGPGKMAGTLGEAGLLSWSAPLDGSGMALLLLRIVDGAGVALVRNFSIQLAPPLAVSASVPSDVDPVNMSLPITIGVAGGEPPYAYSIQLSDGEGTSGSLTGVGRLTWDTLPTILGLLEIRINVTDSLGETNTTSIEVRLDTGFRGINPSDGSDAPSRHSSAHPR